MTRSLALRDGSVITLTSVEGKPGMWRLGIGGADFVRVLITGSERAAIVAMLAIDDDHATTSQGGGLGYCTEPELGLCGHPRPCPVHPKNGGEQ